MASLVWLGALPGALTTHYTLPLTLDDYKLSTEGNHFHYQLYRVETSS
jgi:hypothetical protein